MWHFVRKAEETKKVWGYLRVIQTFQVCLEATLRVHVGLRHRLRAFPGKRYSFVMAFSCLFWLVVLILIQLTNYIARIHLCTIIWANGHTMWYTNVEMCDDVPIAPSTAWRLWSSAQRPNSARKLQGTPNSDLCWLTALSAWNLFWNLLQNRFQWLCGTKPVKLYSIKNQRVWGDLERYLATSLLLADNNDMVRMIVNSVKTDMASGNEAQELWLSTAKAIRSLEMIEITWNHDFKVELTSCFYHERLSWGNSEKLFRTLNVGTRFQDGIVSAWNCLNMFEISRISYLSYLPEVSANCLPAHGCLGAEHCGQHWRQETKRVEDGELRNVGVNRYNSKLYNRFNRYFCLEKSFEIFLRYTCTSVDCQVLSLLTTCSLTYPRWSCRRAMRLLVRTKSIRTCYCPLSSCSEVVAVH